MLLRGAGTATGLEFEGEPPGRRSGTARRAGSPPRRRAPRFQASRALIIVPLIFQIFQDLSRSFLELDDLLGPWEYHRCHEVEDMIANDGIESSVGGMCLTSLVKMRSYTGILLRF